MPRRKLTEEEKQQNAQKREEQRKLYESIILRARISLTFAANFLPDDFREKIIDLPYEEQHKRIINRAKEELFAKAHDFTYEDLCAAVRFGQKHFTTKEGKHAVNETIPFYFPELAPPPKDDKIKISRDIGLAFADMKGKKGTVTEKNGKKMIEYPAYKGSQNGKRLETTVNFLLRQGIDLDEEIKKESQFFVREQVVMQKLWTLIQTDIYRRHEKDPESTDRSVIIYRADFMKRCGWTDIASADDELYRAAEALRSAGLDYRGKKTYIGLNFFERVSYKKGADQDDQSEDEEPKIERGVKKAFEAKLTETVFDILIAKPSLDLYAPEELWKLGAADGKSYLIGMELSRHYYRNSKDTKNGISVATLAGGLYSTPNTPNEKRDFMRGLLRDLQTLIDRGAFTSIELKTPGTDGMTISFDEARKLSIQEFVSLIVHAIPTPPKKLKKALPEDTAEA